MIMSQTKINNMEVYNALAMNPDTMEIEQCEVTKSEFEGHHTYTYEFKDGKRITQGFTGTEDALYVTPR